MSRLRRCLSGSAVSLSLACAGCFSPTGSVPATSGSTDASTTADITTTGPATSTSTSTTSSDTSTGATTSSTDPGSTTTPTTGSSSSSSSSGSGVAETDSTTQIDMPECGNGVLEPGEQCDAGDANADTAPCKSNCTSATCGDGLRCVGCAPVEECDDDNLRAGDGCNDTCRIEGRLMFVTPTVWAGNVTVPKADQICLDLGTTYFAPDRQFVAWLATPDQPLKEHIGQSESPYRLPSGEVVAWNTGELLDGKVIHAVDQEPTGAKISGGDDCGNTSNLVWTGAHPDGFVTTDHCQSWTATRGQGWAGFYASSGQSWTIACPADCSALLRLYCIEKAT